MFGPKVTHDIVSLFCVGLLCLGGEDLSSTPSLGCQRFDAIFSATVDDECSSPSIVRFFFCGHTLH